MKRTLILMLSTFAIANASPSGADIFKKCGICHGDKGDGEGFLVREDGGTYPSMPANFLSDDFKNSSDGRYYYAIMKGRNMMESFNDKINYKERWQVIKYIRSLQ